MNTRTDAQNRWAMWVGVLAGSVVGFLVFVECYVARGAS